MSLITGYIGAAVFHSISPRPSPKQIQYRDITEPWEDGNAYAAMGIRGPVERLTGRIDLTSPAQIPATLTTYAGMKTAAQLVRIYNGTAFMNYGLYWVLDVQDVTDEQWYAAVATGGVNNGQYVLTTQWTLQHV